MFEEDEWEKELSIRFGSFIDSTSETKKHVTINLETAADGIVNLSKDVNFNVFDNKGTLQLSGEGKEIDISEFESGIYMIQFGHQREKLIVR